MASGRMEFRAESIMQHTSFCFVLPNDVYREEVKNKRHYERPTKSLILLHGLTGSDTDWLYGGVAQEMAIQYNLAVFMPTTGNSFYLDRGYPGGNFSEFIGVEFPQYIQNTFGYCNMRENTIIAGLSMGGFGAIHTALAYPDTFSSCIALSSALVLYEIARTGKRKNGVMPEAMVRDVFGNQIPSIYLAIGTEDNLYEHNQVFRNFLKNEEADFFYEEGPGVHNWTFWNEYLPKGLEWVLK